MLLGLIATLGCVTIMRHEPELAAKLAVTFIETACVKHDFETAKALVAGSWWDPPSAMTAKRFVDATGDCGSPMNVISAAYQPMPGQAAIMVYVTAATERGASIYYRLSMAGTAADGYRVAGFYMSRSGPYPGSEHRIPVRGLHRTLILESLN